MIRRSKNLFSFFFFNDTATTGIYTLSLHDALPIFDSRLRMFALVTSGSKSKGLLILPVVFFIKYGSSGRKTTDLIAPPTSSSTSSEKLTFFFYVFVFSWAFLRQTTPPSACGIRQRPASCYFSYRRLYFAIARISKMRSTYSPL